MFVSVGSLNVLGAWIGDGIESSRADISGKNNAIEQSKFSASSLIRLYSILEVRRHERGTHTRHVQARSNRNDPSCQRAKGNGYEYGNEYEYEYG